MIDTEQEVFLLEDVQERIPTSGKRVTRVLPGINGWTNIGAVALVLFAGFSVWYYVHLARDGAKTAPVSEALSDFGQYLGGVISAATGLVTVLFVAKAYLQQRKELAEAKTEAIQANEHNQRIYHLSVTQNINQTLFSWLSSYDALINSISRNSGTSGRRVLQELYIEWFASGPVASEIENNGQYASTDPDNRTQAFIRYIINGNGLTSEELDALYRRSSDVLLDRFGRMYSSNRADLDSIFRTMYRLLWWLDTLESLTSREKYDFVALVRSRYSWIEQAFFLCNCMTPRGEKFALLAEKYALFDNFEIDAREILCSVIQWSKTPTGTDHFRNHPTFQALSESAFSSDLAKIALGIST
ncbi:hypothetical protein G3N59_31715 [Paraburkholderia sp. Ac-20340]|uniref:putative phage abortive infection protein n=1 Tax=Paraburkholderia sp. Ac-20340 TaxID=2703888 RepID=UPI0019800211|nr:putative phage abortive infection protein [Paraburkholderia sp. Ac-20340]MBN3857962.1 hypothetical protein [Paraburkholderia sp. Ac-20340]